MTGRRPERWDVISPATGIWAWVEAHRLKAGVTEKTAKLWGDTTECWTGRVYFPSLPPVGTVVFLDGDNAPSLKLHKISFWQAPEPTGGYVLMCTASPRADFSDTDFQPGEYTDQI